MKKTLFAAPAVVLMLSVALEAAEPLATLLVVPARRQMIQLAFDMQSLRQAEVVCWQDGRKSTGPDLNYWTGKAWEPITVEQFKSHARLSRKPQKIIFMGLDIPPVLEEAFAGGTARFETFDTAMLVNNLDAFYTFSKGEWSLLSKRYHFMLRDVNEKLRRQDPYSNPPPAAQPRRRRAPVVFDNPPPAEIVEESAPAAQDEADEVTAPDTNEAPEAEAEEVTTETIDTGDTQTVEPEAELKPDVPAAGVDSKPVAVPEAK